MPGAIYRKNKLLLALAALAAQGFQVATPAPSASLRHIRARSAMPVLMADESAMPGDAPAKEDAAPAAASAGGYETFYDDEREDAVLAKKPELSNTMRERLINESRGLGADPNAKNPFLPVFFGVGAFVLLGALAVTL